MSDLTSVSINFKTRQDTCELHGEFESKNYFRDHWSKCPECQKIESDKDAEKRAEKQRKEDAYRWMRSLGHAGIPERFHDRTLDKFIATSAKQEFALKFAKEYAQSFDDVLKSGRCAIFCGQPGTGKTHLSVGIGLDVMRNRRSVLFTTVARMMRRVKDTFKKDSEESESEVVDLFASPSLLIVDEIGVQFGSEFERNMMFDILNDRYENRMPTLLLSNLTPSEVKTFLGERVFDRLREDGGKIIPFDWESHRGK